MLVAAETAWLSAKGEVALETTIVSLQRKGASRQTRNIGWIELKKNSTPPMTRTESSLRTGLRWC